MFFFLTVHLYLSGCVLFSFFHKLCHRPSESVLLHSVGGWFISLCCMSLLPTESILASGHFNTWWLDSYELIEGGGKTECYIYSCTVQDCYETAYSSFACLSFDVPSDVWWLGHFSSSYCFLLIMGLWRKRSHFTILTCSTMTRCNNIQKCLQEM